MVPSEAVSGDASSLWPLRILAEALGGVRGLVELIVNGELEMVYDVVH